ncbi:MAG: sigma-54-dependent transcriptional regulator [Bacteriovoracaceae bacterium]
MKILVVDDEKLARLSLKGFLKGHDILEAATFASAKKILENEQIDFALLDLDLDRKLAGLGLAKIAKKMGIYSIITTGRGEDAVAEKAYQLGCQDYLQKPITQKSLDLAIGRYLSFENGTRVDSLIRSRYLTNHNETLNELSIIKGLGISTKPVLICGPTGTGKTIVADLIREVCRVPKEKFVAINCAQYTENLLESELFGYKKGAFTGATSNKTGLLEIADGGIVFLDEIHSLSKTAQQKLMKAIEEKEFYPIGSTSPIKSNFRVICATCEDLLTLVAEKSFRDDFYARISHIKIELFPLRNRPDDILPLIEFFNSKYLRKITITDAAKKLLRSLEWKSNTRDIEALVEYWNIKGYGIINEENIPDSFIKAKPLQKSKLSKSDLKRIKDIGIKDYLEQLKIEIVEHFMELNDFNQSETARDLKVSDMFIRHAGRKIKGELITSKEKGFYEERIQ